MNNELTKAQKNANAALGSALTKGHSPEISESGNWIKWTPRFRRT